jgi:hypothetical protein
VTCIGIQKSCLPSLATAGRLGRAAVSVLLLCDAFILGAAAWDEAADWGAALELVESLVWVLASALQLV